jgi:hypothetical protein
MGDELLLEVLSLLASICLYSHLLDLLLTPRLGLARLIGPFRPALSSFSSSPDHWAISFTARTAGANKALKATPYRLGRCV